MRSVLGAPHVGTIFLGKTFSSKLFPFLAQTSPFTFSLLYLMRGTHCLELGVDHTVSWVFTAPFANTSRFYEFGIWLVDHPLNGFFPFSLMRCA